MSCSRVRMVFSVESYGRLDLNVSRRARPQQLQAGGLEPVNYHTADAFHEFVAQLRVLLALFAKRSCMEIERSRRLVRKSVEMPPVRLEQPRPAQRVRRSQLFESWSDRARVSAK